MDNSRTSSATLSDSEIVMLASDSTQSNQLYAESLQCNVPRGRRPLRDRTLSVNNSSFNIQRSRKGVGLNPSSRTIVGYDGTVMHNTIQSNADRATLIGSNTTPSHYTSQNIGVRSIERGSTGHHHSSTSNALLNNVSSSTYGNENSNPTGQRVLFWDCGNAEYVYDLLIPVAADPVAAVVSSTYPRIASRVTSRRGLRFYVDNGGKCDDTLTRNVVYKEVTVVIQDMQSTRKG
ncbi:hypothetical protein L1987_44812 [Smallanthus sonchifolius]|uniref:Uncharacterized protein n=1 Tax=Smallanthus sonchifolius TaxID=185202 RepID=A0ACB9GRI2_9ASTR|nr:hypothetical protein L1987_44812 [Smallanthus sonchifolius]